MADKQIKSVNLLPEFLRTNKNSKFLSSTIDQFIQKPQLERLDGYIGSTQTVNYNAVTDIYISESLPLRRDYQLDPALIVKDTGGKITDVIALDDLINEINVKGGEVSNLDRMFRSDFYSYNPQINWDKLVNYQDYYWLVTGPDTVTITGQQLNTTSTYSIHENSLGSAVFFDSDGDTENPLITLYRGNTYNFVINSSNPFYIKTYPSLESGDLYSEVENNGASNGNVITIVIPNDDSIPDTLYYVGGSLQTLAGQFIIKSINEDSQLDVVADILGKKEYTSGLGVKLSNGMKIRFSGYVIPELYRDKDYFVEGVGTAIKLIEYNLLDAPEIIASQYDDDFDSTPFDNYPFDNFKRLPLTPEYITINRASQDLNPWSRYNRWVHKDVITASAESVGRIAVYPINLRAKRPIIEFNADLKLFNFGSVGLPNVDLIDVTTLDAFSNVEGSSGHHVDGILLEQGHRVVFAADTDSMVREKIFEVNFITINGITRLTLQPVDEPVAGSVVAVNLGNKYAGESWWYDGNAWKYAQQHTTLNQAPLFELFDNQAHSYADTTYYNSDFKGNKIFSYDIGTGAKDPVLGFPLKYRNSVGVGSYLFKNHFMTDTISIVKDNQVIDTISSGNAYFKIGNNYNNVWVRAESYPIPQLVDVTGQLYYETPLGLTNNPLNGPLASLTLSGFSDHLNSMIDRTTVDVNNNLRDVGDISSWGNRLISNSNPMSFAHFFIGKKEHSVIDALTKVADQYGQFKLSFLKKIAEIDQQLDPVAIVDISLNEINAEKDIQSSYYLSDMVAYGSDKIVRTWSVTDSRNTVYPITTDYDPIALTLRSVLVYLNGVQLVRDRDYVFVINDSSVEFLVDLSVGDNILINDYTNTVGVFVPPTPTKLGLYPKFVPKIFTDTTYVEPTDVIQGHDGSIMLAYGDYRDAAILELEKRIYNNLKAEYKQDLLDINSVMPGAFRNNDYSLEEVNNILRGDFAKWAGMFGIDYSPNTTLDIENPFTYNYTGSYNSNLNIHLTGSWRSVFKYFYDTERPHSHPWEMLGFVSQPAWWEDEYGPAPYTSGNEILWSDIEQGIIKQGTRAGTDAVYARPGLIELLPVDESGNLVDPTILLANNVTDYNKRQNWKIGEQGPAETAWRRSSHWPFMVQKLLALMKPASYASLMYDPIRLEKNIAGQWTYGPDHKFLNVKSVYIQGDNNTLTSGYSTYIGEVGRQRSSTYNEELKSDLANIDFNLFYKAGGFVSKDKLQIVIDSIDPVSTSAGAILPQEDYTLILNVSNPIKSTGISGIVVQKRNDKFVIKGYDTTHPYFTIYNPVRNATTPSITVGGVSEPFLTWTASSTSGGTGLSTADTTTANSAVAGKFYQVGQLVEYGGSYYRVQTSHRSENEFNASYFQRMPYLPTTGGTTVQTAAQFDKTSEVQIPYGTEFLKIQEVYDLIVGYGAWLEDQGFTFDEFNSDLQEVINWNFTSKEFLYWTTQNWAGNSVITLSPFADQIKFKINNSVVDNIFNSFYEYSVLQANGFPFPQQSLAVNREDGVCTIKVVASADGIYFARLNSIQKEHAIVFNNFTMFNDTVYDIETGYRQRRMKLLGFRTAGWDGDYFSPGFVYDTATIDSWKTYTDYLHGDVVKFNGSYYSANENVIGSSKFDFTKWTILGEKPIAQLIPNFDYKISQFEDFYSLDIDNFDSTQQQLAQHLIGYTPRVYLNNIFTNPISQYKFYQGFIKEKGTRNAISRLSKASIYNLQGEVSYNEEWAFRVGSYGSYETFKEIEVPLIEGTFIENPQIISFVDSIPTAKNDLVHYSLSSDLVIKPVDYDPATTFVTTSSTDVFQIDVAGYVRFDDVNTTAYKESDLLTITDNTTILDGEVTWVGFTKNQDWDALRYTFMPAALVSASMNAQSSDTITFTASEDHELSVGDYISITHFDASVNGVYVVDTTLSSTEFSVINTATDFFGTLTPEEPGLLFKFISTRFATFDSIPSDSTILKLADNSKLWIDSNTEDGNGTWQVYNKIKNYQNSSTIYASERPQGQKLGWSISKQKDSDIFVIGAPEYGTPGEIFVLKELPNASQFKLKYGINTNLLTYLPNDSEAGFGYSVAYDEQEFNSTGYGLVIAGAPFASNVKNNDPTGEGYLVTVRYATDSASTSTRIEEGLVKISSIEPILTGEQTERVLLSPTPSNYEHFGQTIYFNNSSNGRLLLVGAPQTEKIGTGNVYVFMASTTSTNIVDISLIKQISTSTVTNGQVGALWGYSIAGSDNAEVIAVGAPGYFTNTGLVSVFSGTETSFVQTITSPFAKHGRFGEAISVSPTGEYMFISATEVKNADKSLGKVAVYKRSTSGTFDFVQAISNPVVGAGMKFGRAIDINITEDELYITATGLNTHAVDIFNSSSTTFDWFSTTFYDNIKDSGTVYIYNKKTDSFKLANEIKPVDVSTGTNFGYSIAVNKNSLYIGSPAINTEAKTAVYQFYKIDTTASCGWQLYREQDNLVEVDTIQKVTLIDSFNEEVIDYLDVIDPLKGKLVGLASQDLKYRSPFDPAVYSIGSTKTVNDINTNWLDDHIGELWWDLSSVKYVWYEQGDLQYRKNNWGKVFPGSSIDVYEWVGTELLPSEWSTLADTPEGLVDGISGQPKDTDNTVVSVKQIYNSLSNSFSNYYYFWVKNKVTVPNVKNRRISGYQVASLIADPTSYGVEFAAVISNNAIALSNIGGKLVASNVHLNISADVINNNVPRHTEWLLLQENSSTSVPNTLLEKKLIDSLLGHDSLGNPVPDPALSARTRYGVSIRPRQTIFKDRLEALRNLIEFTNDILINERIVGNYNLTNLKSQELPPDEYSGEYDQIVEDIEALPLINANIFVTAQITCEISNGKIINVNIIEPGFGYKNSPTIKFANNKNNAELKATINDLGQITSVEIVNPGYEFTSTPVLEVRPYTVIVSTDSEAGGKWTKRVFDKTASTWVRSHTQTYNTSLYWSYIDWTSSNYNPFLDYSYTINEVYELETLVNIQPGEYVKIKDAGLGTFIVLEKTKTGVNGTFDTDYDIVYSEKGTVQISDSIWNLAASNLGYDQNNAYDQTLYSQQPDLELQYILTALKKDIFVNDLKLNWNLFFFKAVKYALSEQKLLDWAFKTSFINVVNTAGSLDQRPVYKLQNSQYFEDYIREVKPYHTNIRSFTENYTQLEPTSSYTTDFDSPAYYDKSESKFKTVELGNTLTNVYPWKAWTDNYKYEVGSIIIGYPGSGYTSAPDIEIRTAAGDTGSGATARAYIRSGEVFDIEVITPGSGYTKSPKLVFSGGGDNVIPAVAHAQLSNNKVRTNMIGMKFDRTSRRPQIQNITATDSFRCNGSDSEFVLSWLAKPDKSKIEIMVDGSVVLGSDYTVEYYDEYYGNGREYVKHFSKIVFLNDVPSSEQILTVTYIKHTELLNAVDRIVNYYTATSGMPGLDLGQLMTGIVYPKTRIEGLMFDYSSRWDLAAFGQSAWADDIGYYKTISSTATSYAVGTWTSVAVNSVTGVAVGQYVNIISTATNPFTTTTVQVAKVDVPTRTVTFNTTTNFTIANTSTIELWTYDLNATALDSAIIGGTYNSGILISATGTNLDDIVISGSGFLTADSSYAPEELLPGEINESVGINVYTKNADGAPLMVTSYVVVDAYSTATHLMEIVPANTSSVFATFDGRILSTEASTTTSYYSLDWLNNTISITNPTSTIGIAGYSIISVGGIQGDSKAGYLDSVNTIVPTSGTTYISTVSLRSVSSIDSVGSAYVTVNGTTVPTVDLVPSSTDCYYELTYSDEENNRAAAVVYNLPTSIEGIPNVVTAWFFGAEHKYFNEVKSEIININTNTVYPIILNNPPGNIEPLCAQAIVEYMSTSTIGNQLPILNLRQELIPPYVDYYSVTNTLQTTFAITNNDAYTIVGDYSKIRVYRNGSELRRGFDYTFSNITVRINVPLSLGDVIAIVSLTVGSNSNGYDYDIIKVGNECRFVMRQPDAYKDGQLKITTFNNQDSMMIRTESFDGSPGNRYRISRPILNENYIWVSMAKYPPTGPQNLVPLVNTIDYRVLEDRVTIQISDTIPQSPDDIIVIRSVSSADLAVEVLGYRLFNDIFNRTHFKRLSKQNTTYLTQPLMFNDTEIHVNDATVLSPPLLAKNIPGVVIIDGERIEFFTITGNILGQLRRTTLGTAPSFYSEQNTKVIDQSPEQTIPFTEKILVQSTITTTSTVYGISTQIHTGTSSAGIIFSDGIVLDTEIPGKDQIAVYYGGRPLNKIGTFYQDIDISYDSQDVDISVDILSTVDELPDTETIGLAYVVTATNHVWVYTNSNEGDSVNGYIYRGLNYIPPEFTVDISYKISTTVNTTSTLYTTSTSISIPSTPRIVNTYTGVMRTYPNSASDYGPGNLTTYTPSGPIMLMGENYMSSFNGGLSQVVFGKTTSALPAEVGYIVFTDWDGTFNVVNNYYQTLKTSVETTSTYLQIVNKENNNPYSVVYKVNAVQRREHSGLRTGPGDTYFWGLDVTFVGGITSTPTQPLWVGYSKNVDIGWSTDLVSSSVNVTTSTVLTTVTSVSTVTTLDSQQITLNIPEGIQPGVKLTVTKRNSTLWNDGATSLMNSSTMPARFLQARPAELPDTYYYGGETALIDDANFTISDENNDPLEGF